MRRTWNWEIWVLLGLFVFTAVFVLLPIAKQHSSENWAQPLHLFYEGKLYFYRGSYENSLPEGYVLAGNTVNVGNEKKLRNLECNHDGTVYVREDASEILYFAWPEWDEEREGVPAPWLRMEAEQEFGLLVCYRSKIYEQGSNGSREPAEKELRGELTPVGGREAPTKSGQISGDELLGREGIPFASFGDDLLVCLDGNWVVFEKVE